MMRKLRAYEDTPLLVILFAALSVVAWAVTDAPVWYIVLSGALALTVYLAVTYVRQYRGPIEVDDSQV